LRHFSATYEGLKIPSLPECNWTYNKLGAV
jgi:hypothetical protein